MDINKSIKCMVESCQHHAGTADYCSLDCITVGTHDATQRLMNVQTAYPLKRDN